MQKDNSELEGILRQAYCSIVENGKSLRKVSEETGIERKRLKILITEILSEEELTKFNNALSKRDNRNKVANTSMKHKKVKALETEEYQKAIQGLTQREVNPEWIEAIYNRCQEKQQTKISRDTLAIKLLELLEYFGQRNENIPEDSQGYVSDEDVVQMILKNPRIISSDINNNIISKCIIITAKNDNDIRLANIKIKRNPGIFRKTIRDIREGK